MEGEVGKTWYQYINSKYIRSHCSDRLPVHKPAALCHIIPRLARQKGFHKHSAEDMGLFTEAVNKAKIAKGLGGQGGGYVTGQ